MFAKFAARCRMDARRLRRAGCRLLSTVPLMRFPIAAERLTSAHDRLWDPDRGLVLVPAGTTPGLDLGALGLHSVRESALGALLDLRNGNPERAVTALWKVLELQYDAPEQPWDGTFPVTAEQEDPPDGAVEFFHYDPNWRQFLGTVLLVVLHDSGAQLPVDLVEGAWDAVVRCATGEPADRIPEWYTNPNLLHAWVAAHAGRHTGDTDLLQSGIARARRAVDRVAAVGDVDEYNSPTYDGVDLIAVSLWTAYPPSPEFADWGTRLCAALCHRISALVDAGTGVVCGPYSRAYGYDLTRYVSLLGLWLSSAGMDRVLPPDLGPATDHAHDLYFLPLVEHLVSIVDLPWDLTLVAAPRRYEQTVGGVVAISVLRPGLAVGWASGPVIGSVGDQYVPFSVHVAGAIGELVYVVARPGPGCHTVEVEELSPTRYRVVVSQAGASVRWTCSSAPFVEGDTALVGPVRMNWTGADQHEVVPATSGDTDVLVTGDVVTYEVEVDVPQGM